jgi:hypothetical protein
MWPQRKGVLKEHESKYIYKRRQVRCIVPNGNKGFQARGEAENTAEINQHCCLRSPINGLLCGHGKCEPEYLIDEIFKYPGMLVDVVFVIKHQISVTITVRYKAAVHLAVAFCCACAVIAVHVLTAIFAVVVVLLLGTIAVVAVALAVTAVAIVAVIIAVAAVPYITLLGRTLGVI